MEALRPKSKVVLDPNKFDLRTHEWDARGKLINLNTYRSFIIDGRQYFERPVNSGNLWFENNKPAGRVELTFGEDGKIATKKFEFESKHKEWSAPLDGNAKLHYEVETLKGKNASLETELAAIRKEREELAKLKADIESMKAQQTTHITEVVNSVPSLKKHGGN